MYSTRCTCVEYLWLSNTRKNKLHIKMMSPWDLRHIYWYGRGEDKKKQKQETSGRGTGKWEKRVTRSGNFRPPYPQFQTPGRGTPHHDTITTWHCVIQEQLIFAYFFLLKTLCFTGSWRGNKLILDSYVKLKFSRAEQYGTSKQRIYTITIPFPK